MPELRVADGGTTVLIIVLRVNSQEKVLRLAYDTCVLVAHQEGAVMAS